MQRSLNDVSICHRLTIGNKDPKPKIDKFVRREKGIEKGIEKRNIFVIDDLTTICANITSQLVKSESLGNVFTVSENVVVFMQGEKRFFSKIS